MKKNSAISLLFFAGLLLALVGFLPFNPKVARAEFYGSFDAGFDGGYGDYGNGYGDYGGDYYGNYGNYDDYGYDGFSGYASGYVGFGNGYNGYDDYYGGYGNYGGDYYGGYNDYYGGYGNYGGYGDYYGNYGGCTSCGHNNIPQVPQPISLSCSPTLTTLHAGESTTWTAQVSGGDGAYSYSWTGSDGLSGSGPNVSKNYSTSGVKSASVTVNSGGQSRTASCGNVTVTEPASELNPLAVSCSVTPGTVHKGESATWNAVATGGNGNYSYTWTGSDGLTGSSNSLGKVYALSGYKTGSVTVTSGNQTVVRSCGSVFVDEPPVSQNPLTGTCSLLSGNTNPSIGSNVTWRAIASGGDGNYQYSWNGDQISGSGNTATASYSSPGTKFAEVRITSGTETIVRQCGTVTVAGNVPPVSGNIYATCRADVNSATTGQNVIWNVQAYGGTGIYFYSWNGADGLYGNGPSISKQYYSPGSKYAQVTVTSGGQSTTATCNPVFISSVLGYSSNVTVSTQPYKAPAAVYLSQVPYTGIGFGWKLAIFFGLIILWSSYISYRMIKRRMNKDDIEMQIVEEKQETIFSGLEKMARAKNIMLSNDALEYLAKEAERRGVTPEVLLSQAEISLLKDADGSDSFIAANSQKLANLLSL